MFKSVQSIAFILFLLFNMSSKFSFAQQEISKEKKTKILIEIDPFTFAYKGYGMHFRLQPAFSEHLLLGIGAYAMNMPDALVAMNSINRAKAWSVRLNQGLGLFTEYHFAEVNKKWFVGGQLGVQQYKINKSELKDYAKFSNLLLMVNAGYSWQIAKTGFYLKPWTGIGYTSKITGSNILNGEVYDVAAITMFATLHVGYSF